VSLVKTGYDSNDRTAKRVKAAYKVAGQDSGTIQLARES
jgi:hypothetical protein